MENESWVRQIILDSISINESLPLRIIDAKGFEGLKAALKTTNVNALISKRYKSSVSKKENDKINLKLEKLRKKYNKISQTIFPILPANPHTLEFLNQTMIKHWRIYSVLWLYNEIKTNHFAEQSKTCIIKNFYGLNNFTAVLTPINDEENNTEFFLIGPVFTLSSDDVMDEGKVEQEITDPVIEKIVNFSKNNNVNEHIRRSYLTLAINSKPVCNEERLLTHIDGIKHNWKRPCKPDCVNSSLINQT